MIGKRNSEGICRSLHVMEGFVEYLWGNPCGKADLTARCRQLLQQGSAKWKT
jgi:hypothetical protein